MQPTTTLNKVVSLFLVGGIVMLGIAAVVWRHFGPHTVSHELSLALKAAGDNTLAVVGGLLAISLAAVCGAACESLTDLFVRPLVKGAAKSKEWTGRLGQAGTFKYHDFWLRQFKRVVFSSEPYKDFPHSENAHGLAVGILYGSKQAESIAWAESHYATYILASNLTLLSGLLFLYVFGLTLCGWCTFTSSLLGMALSAGLFYAFLSLSLDRYLYSYQVAMRTAVIVFSHPPENEH